jgi:hypothetical protein
MMIALRQWKRKADCALAIASSRARASLHHHHRYDTDNRSTFGDMNDDDDLLIKLNHSTKKRMRGGLHSSESAVL